MCTLRNYSRGVRHTVFVPLPVKVAINQGGSEGALKGTGALQVTATVASPVSKPGWTEGEAPSQEAGPETLREGFQDEAPAAGRAVLLGASFLRAVSANQAIQGLDHLCHCDCFDPVFSFDKGRGDTDFLGWWRIE